jgi:MIP family channel proteins
MSRAAVAELVGTFILVYAGTTVAVLATLEVPVIGTPFDSLAVPLAFGLTLAALVAALGHVSGAHLNPAVTLGLAATRKFPWNYVPTYVVAQLLGAILGAIATWITVGGEARSQAALASPGLAPGVGILQGFMVEALITFILVFVVISVATDARVADTVAPLAVGFALAAAVFIGGVATGGSANPARALGPIIVAWNNWDSALLYIIAPIVGGVLAAFLYDGFISDADAPQ